MSNTKVGKKSLPTNFILMNFVTKLIFKLQNLLVAGLILLLIS